MAYEGCSQVVALASELLVIILVHSDTLLDTTFLLHPKPKDGVVHSTASLKVDIFSCEGSSCSRYCCSFFSSEASL